MREIEPIYIALGEVMMAFRHERGLTQEELADWLGVLRTSIANMEAGRQRIMLHTVLDLAALMSTEPGELIDRAMERVRQ